MEPAPQTVDFQTAGGGRMRRDETTRRDFGSVAVTFASNVRESVGTATAIWIGAIPEWPNAQTEHEC